MMRRTFRWLAFIGLYVAIVGTLRTEIPVWVGIAGAFATSVGSMLGWKD